MSEQQKTGRNVACEVCGKVVYRSGAFVRKAKVFFCSKEHAQQHRKAMRQKASNCTVCAKEMTGDDLRQFWGKCGRDKSGKIHGMCRACKGRADEERRRKAEEEEKDRRDRIFKTRGGVCAVCGRLVIINSYSGWCRECSTADRAGHKDAVNKGRHRICMADPKSHIKMVFRVAMRQCLKGLKRRRKTFDLLGYSVDDLKCHLERQFLPGMTWENYGRGWHVDHIIPLSAFNFETADDIDFRRAWALSNLRPLWAEDNMRKSDTVERPFQPCLRVEAA